MKTALATIVVTSVAPAAPAAGPRDSSLRLVSPQRYQVLQRGDGAFSLRLGARPAGQPTLQVRSASRHDVVMSRRYVGVGDATTYSPPATSRRCSYRAEPHVNSATASVSSWSRDGSRMVTTISGTRPGLPEPTRTILDCLVAPVLMPSPQG